MTESMYVDGAYLEQNPDWHAEDAPYKAKWISNILKKNDIMPSSIAEVGCGSGEVLLNVGKVFPSALLTGFDISPQAFAISSTKNSEQASFLHEDIRQTDRGPFDLLIAADVFEHVDEYMDFLRSIRPLAKYKIFHIPLDLSVQTILRSEPIMRVREEVGHVHYFYKETALATLVSTGYEIVDWRYTHFSQELPNRPFGMRMLNLPRSIMQRINADFSVRLFGGSSLLVLTK
jgi:2-polyprenyl-3-methyl-5-hydroxy-6-metoxy-1,4-benzoquinol methylase